MARILIIEDDETLSQTYSDFLKIENHDILVAHNGLVGLQTFMNEKIDLLITDLKMPKLEGREMIQKIMGASSDGLPCPVIISSAYIDTDVINQLSSYDKLHFLPKPSSKKEFLNIVRRVLSPDSTATIDVNFINPILNAAISVIREMTNLDVKKGKPEAKWPGEVSGDVSAAVNIVSSGFKGTLAISFQEAGFLNLFSPEQIGDSADQHKLAATEVLLQIFKLIKTKLEGNGHNMQFAIPNIVIEKNHSIQHQSKCSTIVIPFHSSALGNFRIEFSALGVP